MNKKGKLPIGMASFEGIIRDGRTYVDKTELMWEMIELSKYIFLSRPRRFGKSLLVTTLKAYFEGKRELFEGMKITELEKEWLPYPVIRLDLSLAKARSSAGELRNALALIIEPYEELYGKNESERMPGERLNGVIKKAFEQTGKQVVLLIDEYDAPMLDMLNEDEKLDDFRQVMQEFYMPLKASEEHIKFCFITGITKFSQLSIFSTINNLKNISLLPDFATICGITEEELKGQLKDYVEDMAIRRGCTYPQMLDKLKERYDGYHFAGNSPGVYNPFSLLNALMDKELNNYWFASGTPTFLIQKLKEFNTDAATLDDKVLPSSKFDLPTEALTDALPLLYQSGYLTIKGYDSERLTYTLGIPNQEVSIGLAEGLLPTYTSLDQTDVQLGFAYNFWKALKDDDINIALEEMKAFLAGVPYVNGFKKKLEDVATKEGFYEWTLYLIFSMLNVYTRTQVRCAGGRADIVVHMPNTIYVMELKMNGTAQEALDQINNKGYALPYATSGKKVVKVGIEFDPDAMTAKDWIISPNL